MSVTEENRKNAERARKLYVEGADPVGEATDWAASLAEIRLQVVAALAASHDLRDLRSALEADGKHMLIFRHLLAPPKSQDQFKLLCDEWSKGSEKSGLPQKPNAVRAVSEVLVRWMDREIAPWLSANRDATEVERERLIERVISFIAPKLTDTQKRNRLSAEQETAVVKLLRSLNWTQLPSVTIDTRAAVAPKHFMNKTRFATATTTAQEVDIACGFAASYVAAMECKVTNDATNSVKRINDVLKKAAAWKAHWGSFVETAALLQGVIKPEDVQRLTDEGVRVFWSHDLDAFARWVQSRV
ncbi:XamI family restriction endonuclease [Albidovulum sediminicola]|uniref:XamI family restriction endonuclease n=1 Tax=Albidovulum sediminicola TaxID=2984331 RepID=A0ABT2Z757_9RHOB|nr:XamI family restriction endonuclease [Defluviimonas sp. WL0075]MCV2866921.1 XamI family restriction endonuclease [Defluviimonas sp. WL0075]